MCGRVFVIAVLASLAVPSVAEEIAEVDAPAQFKLIRKRVVEDASDVTAASAVNAGAVETGKEALVVSAGEEQQEGEAKEEEVADAEEDEEEEEEEEGPGPGWGPVRVGARSGLGPIWAHRGLMGP